MAYDILRQGIGSSAAFQVSGFPWITGSIITASIAYKKIVLPAVAKSVTVKNVDASQIFPYNFTGSTDLLVFFGPDLTGTYPPPQVTNQHCISIPASGSVTFDVKCSQFFVAKRLGVSSFGAFQALVELTSCQIADLVSGSVVDGQIDGSGIRE